MPSTNISPARRQETMADATSTIKRNWTIKGFLKEFGKNRMQVAKCHNSDGEEFKCLAFTDTSAPEPKKTLVFVAFSNNLRKEIGKDHLTPSEIIQQKDNLQIVECETKNGDTMYSMCRPGGEWEDVDIDQL